MPRAKTFHYKQQKGGYSTLKSQTTTSRQKRKRN